MVGGPSKTAAPLWSAPCSQHATCCHAVLLRVSAKRPRRRPTGIFCGSIKEFQAPAAICGYAAVAGALLLARELPAAGLRTRAEAEAMAVRLQDARALLPDIRAAMQFVQQSRARYVAGHTGSFGGRRAENEYMKAWVANYEISDFLSNQLSGGSEGGLLLPLPPVFCPLPLPAVCMAPMMLHQYFVLSIMRLELQPRCFSCALTSGQSG